MTGAVGPLAKLMIDHANVIDEAIENYGASAVAEFFVNVGTGIAAAYDLGRINEEIKALPTEGGED